MSKIKRKPRNKMSKTVDILRPINLNIIGSADDPCFGRFNEPKCEACSRCGDAEICAIVMQQKNALKRGEVEESSTFKDMEEKDMTLADKKKVRKMVKNRIRELARIGRRQGIGMEQVIFDVHSTYAMHGFTRKRVEKLINIMVEKSDHLYIDKNLLKYK